MRIPELDNRGVRPRPGALRAHFQFILNGKRFAYCRIRKNGCSAFQQFIVETSPYTAVDSENGFDFLRRCHRVGSTEVLESADHRILIFRDPIERIHSLFVNKFVQRQGFVGIFNNYAAVTGDDPGEASFEDFVVNYLSRLRDVALDPHVWPQNWHLCNVVYDHVFSLSRLHECAALTFGLEIAARFFSKKINPSPIVLEIGAEMRERLLEIYAEDLSMIQRITR